MRGLLVAFALLSACTPRSASLEDPVARRAIARIRIVQDAKSEEWKILKEVEGVSCRRSAYSPVAPSRDDATEQMKIAAGKLGADAIINIACAENGTDWGHNCFNSVVCHGDAAMPTGAPAN